MNRTLHCGPAIASFLTHIGKAPPSAPSGRFGWSAAMLFGWPVIVDPNMDDGAFELREGDAVVYRSRVGEPGARVVYVPALAAFLTVPAVTV